MGRSPLQKREAEAIAKKLGAKIKKDGAHQRAFFEYDGAAILSFGIRHGAKSGHGFLVGVANGDLRISESGAVKMANCTMSKDEYVAHLKKIGVIVS